MSRAGLGRVEERREEREDVRGRRLAAPRHDAPLLEARHAVAQRPQDAEGVAEEGRLGDVRDVAQVAEAWAGKG